MGSDYRVRCCPDGLVTDRRRRTQVLDCTIRDGGISNNWHFDHELVEKDRYICREFYESLADNFSARDDLPPWPS